MSLIHLQRYWKKRNTLIKDLYEKRVPFESMFTAKTALDNELKKEDPVAFRAVYYSAQIELSEMATAGIDKKKTVEMLLQENDPAQPMSELIYGELVRRMADRPAVPAAERKEETCQNPNPRSN